MDHHRTKDDLAEAAIAAWASSKATQLECVDVENGAEFRVVLPMVEARSGLPEFAEVSFDAA